MQSEHIIKQIHIRNEVPSFFFVQKEQCCGSIKYEI
jgi:hypothetical protein